MRIEAIAWDIDGTLVDSEPLHQEALNAISHDLGIFRQTGLVLL